VSGDWVGVSSVQIENGVTTLTPLGDFTNNGTAYSAAIERLAPSAGDQPPIAERLMDEIRRVAAARDELSPGADAAVLVLATPWLSLTEINDISHVAQQHGVRVSAVVRDNFGFPDIAARTAGFVADREDPRRLEMIFGAMDRLLAGNMPFYRMEFRVKGAGPGTFLSGGNAKIRLEIDVPTSTSRTDIRTIFDVAIP
jgi:hypothetical protein